MFWGATGGIWQSACFTSHLDFFREEGDDFWSANKDAYFPRILVDNFAKNQKTQTRYLQNAAYVRLKNLQIGYTIPAQITRKIGVSNLRVFFSGENLFTLRDCPEDSTRRQLIPVMEQKTDRTVQERLIRCPVLFHRI